MTKEWPTSKPAQAEFSVDMVQTLLTYFQAYEIDGVVKVEVTEHGL